MNRSLPLCLLALSPGAAFAQVLPSPARTPSTKGPAPTFDEPLPNESPLLIGEPVRHQSATPTKLAKVAPKSVHSGSVAGVSVAGKSDAQALAQLRKALAPQLQAPFRTVIGGYQYTFRRDELGAQIPFRSLLTRARRGEDVPLQLEVDRAKLNAALRELDGQVREDFDATALDLGVSARRIEVALELPNPAPREALVTIRIEKDAPTPEPVETPAPQVGKGQFPFLLASFSTKYDAKFRGRTTNLKMAATHINGTVVPEGKVFSTNKAIGPRNAASGWREANMFVSGRVVSGTGAGICQAASTLYNCALLGNFPIVERHAHSMRVLYVPPSQDAALMWGQKDFKFRNNSGGAIRVETSVSGGKFHTRIWGQKERRIPKIELVSTITSRQNGMRSTAFKLVGGQKIKLSSDYYRPHPD